MLRSLVGSEMCIRDRWYPPTSDVGEPLFILAAGATGPAGPAGPQGPTGVKGDKGEPGQDAPADTARNAASALARTAVFRPITVWERTETARTLLFEYRPLEAVHTNINATVVIGGSTINNVNPSEGVAALDDVGIILEVPITAAQAGNISTSTEARDGYVRCQITAGSAATVTGWMRTKPADTDTVVTPAELALFRRRNPTAIFALTDGANIAWDTDSGLFATVTLGGNRTLANPTNVQTGDVLVLEVVQDGTGSRTLAFGSNFVGPAVTLEGGANEATILTFLALSPTRLLRGPAVARQ